MTRMDGKTAIVTGAANGIGRAIARALAGAGANVVVCDVLADDGERTVGEINSAGGTAAFVQADVSDSEQAEGLIARAVERFGGLDVLANNAGIGGGMARLHEIEPADFDRVIAVNLRGTFLCSKYAIPHFLAQHDGRIVNTASTYGLIGAPARRPTARPRVPSSISPGSWRLTTVLTGSGSTPSAPDISTPSWDGAARGSVASSSSQPRQSANAPRQCSRSGGKASRPKSPRWRCFSPPTRPHS